MLILRRVIAEPLRRLALRGHPRGVPHLSAASGLVCAQGRAYVVGDDEVHLALFDDARRPGRLHRLLPGSLPLDPHERKRVKPDFETLFLLPPSSAATGGTLIVLGSGSTPARDRGVAQALDAMGEPSGAARAFDLSPLYGPLRALWGEVNIEGAAVIGGALQLLHRGVAGRHPNATVRYTPDDLRDLMHGGCAALLPRQARTWPLGSLDGVELGFTDAATLPDGGWLFSAAAEDRRDSVADGPCAGSVLGLVAGDGALRSMWRVVGPVKVEGIDVRVHGRRIDVCMVTDADDPAQPAWLWRAQLSY